MAASSMSAMSRSRPPQPHGTLYVVELDEESWLGGGDRRWNRRVGERVQF